MPKYKSHIGYSLLPSVCFDSRFVEVLIRSIPSITRMQAASASWKKSKKQPVEVLNFSGFSTRNISLYIVKTCCHSISGSPLCFCFCNYMQFSVIHSTLLDFSLPETRSC